MKKLFLFPLLAVLFASCSNSDTTSDPVADLSTKTNMVIQSDWKVTQYIDSGKDETGDFAGYSFTFNTDGSFTAVSSSATYTGSWILAAGSSSPDDSGNSTSDDNLDKLTITVSGNNLEKITATEIWLRDDNVASNELIRFGK
jgi:hypothetical protein